MVNMCDSLFCLMLRNNFCDLLPEESRERLLRIENYERSKAIQYLRERAAEPTPNPVELGEVAMALVMIHPCLIY